MIELSAATFCLQWATGGLAFLLRDVSFPLYAKIKVNGPEAHPLYVFLKSQQKGLLGAAIKWNFTKFLVDRQGEVVGRYAPTDKPESIRKDIEALL